jgi:hypothetical protein
MGRATERDWPPTAQYQSIALISVLVYALSKEIGKTEDEILAELESIR